MILDTWRAFAAHAEPDTTYVFNCVLLQNPMCETMMRFGMSEDESRQYIGDIAAIIAPLHPVVIYIDAPDAKAAIDGVLEERGDGWLNAVIDSSHRCIPSSSTLTHRMRKRRLMVSSRSAVMVGSTPSSITTRHKGMAKCMVCADTKDTSRALRSVGTGNCVSYVHFRWTATSSRH